MIEYSIAVIIINKVGIKIWLGVIKKLYYLGIFPKWGTLFDPLGPFGPNCTIWDLLRQKSIFRLKNTKCFLAKVVWSKKSSFVWNGPKGPKNVPNGQKHVILTIWDHLGPFWTTSGHWQACHDRPFLVPNGPFLMPPSHGFMAQWSRNGFESSPHMGQG